MDINRQNMTEFFQTLNAAFHAGMQSTGQRVTPEQVLLEQIAMMGRSSGASAMHGWLSQIGGMREWIGDRVVANILSGKLSIVNRKFEKTIEVPRDDIDDDNHGIYTPLVSAMGVSAGMLWMKLAIDALVANGEWADGLPFFGTDRTYSGQAIVNATASALDATTFAAARVAMMSYKLDGDEPAEVLPVVLLVGPKLRDTAWNIVKNDFVSAGTGKGGNLQNPNKDAVALAVSPRLVGAHEDKWFLLGEQTGFRGIYVQKRKDPKFTGLFSDTDENVFWRDKFVYGTDARGEAFLTFPHLIYSGKVISE